LAVWGEGQRSGPVHRQLRLTQGIARVEVEDLQARALARNVVVFPSEIASAGSQRQAATRFDGSAWRCAVQMTQFLTRSEVPEAYAAVASDGDQRLAIGGKGEVGDRSDETLAFVDEGAQQFAAGRIPDMDRALAGGGKQFAVVGESHSEAAGLGECRAALHLGLPRRTRLDTEFLGVVCFSGALGSLEAPDLGSTGDVPQAHGLVFARRHQPAPIGREAEEVD